MDGIRGEHIKLEGLVGDLFFASPDIKSLMRHDGCNVLEEGSKELFFCDSCVLWRVVRMALRLMGFVFFPLENYKRGMRKEFVWFENGDSWTTVNIIFEVVLFGR